MSTRAAARGIGYQLWLKSRLAVVAVFATAVVLRAALHLAAASDTARVVVAFIGMLPIGFALTFLVGIFSYSGDLSRQESGFPRHMFVLPVSARVLALSPLLAGAMCLSAIWIGVAQFVLKPAGLPVPVLWPAVMLTAFLVWIQATSWMPFWISYVRVAACVGSVFVVIAFVLTVRVFGYPESLLVGGLLGAIGLGMIAAVEGVARARRGDGAVSPWADIRLLSPTVVPRRSPFKSGERAQIWLELRRGGPLVAMLVLAAPVLTFVLLLFHCNPPSLYVRGLMVPGSFFLLAIGLGTPPFFAGLVGGNLGRADPWAKSLATPAFLAARPMTDATLAAAKLKASAIMVIASWAVILTILLAGCLLPHTYSPTESLAQFFLRHGTGRGVIAACALVGGLIVYTWISLAAGIAVSLSGRARLNEAVMITGCIGFAGVMALGAWVTRHPQLLPKVLAGTRVAMVALVVAKVVIAVLVTRAILRNRIAPPRSFIGWSLVWLMFAIAAYATALHYAAAALQSRSGMALGLALAIPYNRLLGLPLAWHHNRHR